MLSVVLGTKEMTRLYGVSMDMGSCVASITCMTKLRPCEKREALIIEDIAYGRSLIFFILNENYDICPKIE